MVFCEHDSEGIQLLVSASNYDVVSIAGNLLIYTTPSFEALTILHYSAFTIFALKIDSPSSARLLQEI